MQYEHRTRRERTDLDCVACGHEGVTVDDREAVTCPNCGESYSLVVGDGFTLLEAGGWAARITLEVSDEPKPGLAN